MGLRVWKPTMRRQPRSAPKSPESRAVQMLFGHPEYWDQLSADEHELLHGLPAPHGPLVAWLKYGCTIPLFDWPEVVQRTGKLHNFTPNPGSVDSWNAADWWLST